ncbi:Ribonuclease H domain - like 10 [Theobroma cacao]|nr:Ribonuclease H domain - like 10 [Theobroma cacao]
MELQMKEKGIHLASKCVCCNSEESLIHVLWENPVAKQKKPSIGEYKLNVDGSSWNGPHAASGGVLRDHAGKLIFGFSENIDPCNSLQAELQALLRGLLLCKEHRIEKLWIEMDALVAIQLIQLSKKGSHDIRYLLESIRMCLRSFSYRILHIFREGNQAVDFLSNEGHNHQNLCLFTEAQDQLQGMLKLDRLNLPYVRFQGM